jgi:hypothetical protein
MVSWSIMRARARAIAAAGLALGLVLGAGTARAQDTSLTLSEASRSGAIPWDRLELDAYELVRDVVQGAAVAREVRDITFRSHKPILDFLLDHPDFAADVARVLREGKYYVRRVGSLYEADDGRAVIALDSEHLEGPDGVTYCAMRFAGFLKLDSLVADSFARVLQSFSEDQMDRRVRRFFGHVAKVSRRAYDDPEGLADLLAGRPELAADRLAEFRALLLASVPPSWAADGEYRFLDSPTLPNRPE